jgi:hypothetical protein
MLSRALDEVLHKAGLEDSQEYILLVLPERSELARNGHVR